MIINFSQGFSPDSLKLRGTPKTCSTAAGNGVIKAPPSAADKATPCWMVKSCKMRVSIGNRAGLKWTIRHQAVSLRDPHKTEGTQTVREGVMLAALVVVGVA